MKRKIDSLLREVALKTTGVKKYGRGAKWADNLDDADNFPRIWIHKITVSDTSFHGVIKSTYTVLGEVCEPIDFDADDSGEMIEEVIAKMTPIVTKYYTNIVKDSRTLTIGTMFREEIIHKGDANLAGFAFKFNITLKEVADQQCS